MVGEENHFFWDRAFPVTLGSIQCLRAWAAQMDIDLAAQPAVMVTDHALLRKFAHAGFFQNVASMSITPHHFDIAKKVADEEHYNTVADVLVLSGAKAIVYSRSGISNMAVWAGYIQNIRAVEVGGTMRGTGVVNPYRVASPVACIHQTCAQHAMCNSQLVPHIPVSCCQYVDLSISALVCLRVLGIQTKTLLHCSLSGLCDLLLAGQCKFDFSIPQSEKAVGALGA